MLWYFVIKWNDIQTFYVWHKCLNTFVGPLHQGGVCVCLYTLYISILYRQIMRKLINSKPLNWESWISPDLSAELSALHRDTVWHYSHQSNRETQQMNAHCILVMDVFTWCLNKHDTWIDVMNNMDIIWNVLRISVCSLFNQVVVEIRRSCFCSCAENEEYIFFLSLQWRCKLWSVLTTNPLPNYYCS